MTRKSVIFQNSAYWTILVSPLTRGLITKKKVKKNCESFSVHWLVENKQNEQCFPCIYIAPMFVYSFLDLKLFIHRYNDILWIFLLVFDDSPSSELLPGHMHDHVESATTLSYVSCKRDYQFWFNEDFKSSAPCLVLTKAIVTNNQQNIFVRVRT